MSTLLCKPRKCTRFWVSALVSLTLAGLMVWGLVTIYEPKAKLNTFNLRKINETHSKIYLEIQLTNRNYFRGYNYTGGWVEAFYVPDSEVKYWDLTWDYTPTDYQGFRKTLNWNFTLVLTPRKLAWATYTPDLKNHDSHIYVSVHLSYFYKILFWTTKKQYYQWLDANVYLNGNFDNVLKVSKFNRTKNFVMAF